ncbi:Esterase E4 [Diplonema papillatum]|nr:Esterase E4 [Diplonema papillatum]
MSATCAARCAWFAFAALAAARPAAGGTVTVPGLGTAVGGEVTVSGIAVEQFLGIPYAAADRWQPPEVVRRWSGTLAAGAYGDTCPGSTCAAQSDPSAAAHLLPVIVYIHGGAHTVGCSNSQAGAQFTATGVRANAEFVFVSINYRLGAFGFLGSSQLVSSDGSTGNYGFQDQRAALQWVQAYIGSFGGDAGNVTVMGLSAGASCITAHIVAPRSRDLFRRAICQSGLGNVRGAKPLAAAEAVFDGILRTSGCAAAACLRALSTQDVRAAQGELPSLGDNDYAVWSPVIDGVELSEHPWTLFSEKQFPAGLTVLGGTALDDYAAFLLLSGLSPSVGELGFKVFISRYLPDDNRRQALLALVGMYGGRSAYPEDLKGYSMWWWAAMRAMTDRTFLCPARKTLADLEAGGAAAVYSYRFDHPSQTFVGTRGTGPGNPFATHGADRAYAYNCSNFPTTCEFDTEPEAILAGDPSAFWAALGADGALPWARYGTPGYTRSLNTDGYPLLSHVQDAECAFWIPILNATYA